MARRRLYLTITTEPLSKAIENGDPAVETSVEVGGVSGKDLIAILNESLRRLEGDDE
jgi:hypothetical protein